MSSRKIVIFGSGLIGRSWAMLYAAADYRVTLYDLDRKQIDSALRDIEQQLTEYETKGILKGSRNATEQLRLIDGCDDLKVAIEGALLIQECVPENLPLKQDVMRQIDELLDDDAETIVASSTSTFLPSRFASDLKHKRNVLVAHPVCPPYLIPLVEIVPAPFTDARVIETVRQLMLTIGQEPVVLKKEVDGFALNRLQYAILNEAWDMVSKGVLTVAEIDKVMSEGLGLRYAFAGPFMTAHLNANGMKDYCDRYANSIYNVSCTMEQTAKKWQEPEISQISAAMNEIAPVSTLPDRRQERSECLFHLFKLKKTLNESSNQ